MSHRKVDVDIDDEDQYDEVAVVISADEASRVANEVNARVSEVQTYLQRGDVTNAVLTSLQNPPAAGIEKNIRDKNSAAAIESLSAAKVTDITAIVKKLNPDQIDTLAKYIYKGLSQPETYNSGILLSWHEKLVEVGGIQAIVKVLVDKEIVV